LFGGSAARRLGGEAVTAVDPSETFVAAARARHPTVEVLQASAERLPFEDSVFDVALAQFVIHFKRVRAGSASVLHDRCRQLAICPSERHDFDRGHRQRVSYRRGR